MDIRYCPRCRTPLNALFNGRAELDHCGNCRGNWLESGKTAQTFGAWAEPSHWVETHIATEKSRSGIWCPAGHGRLVAYDLVFDKTEVEIDVCPECSGMWLDQHEGGVLADIVGRFEEKKGTPPGVLAYFFQLLTGFPIEVFNPVKRTPWLVYSLIVANVLVFGLELALMSGADGGRPFILEYSLVPSEAIRGVGLHAFITHAFLHGGVMHIVGNMYFLWIFGDNIEDRCGRLGFLLVYVSAAFLGAGAHMFSDLSSDVPMLGASGAISGLMGAYLVLFPRVRVWVVFFFIRFQISIYWYFGVWVGMQILGVVTNQFGVAFWAHIGGFVAGLGVGFIFRLAGNKKAATSASAGPRRVDAETRPNLGTGPRGF